LRAAGPEGLLHSRERERIDGLEQALVHGIHDGRTGIYCGSCTTGGQRDYLFYLADDSGWEQRARRILAAFPEYGFHCFSHMETRWDTYFHFLLPEEGEMPSVHAHALRAGLLRRKIPLHRPRPLTHSLSFCSAADRENFRLQACEEGFIPETDGMAHASIKPHCLRVRRADKPGAVERVIAELKELAEAHGGSYERLEETGRQAFAFEAMSGKE
jgi:hypothetical protein